LALERALAGVAACAITVAFALGCEARGVASQELGRELESSDSATGEIACFGPPAWDTGTTSCVEDFCVPRQSSLEITSNAPTIRRSSSQVIVSAHTPKARIRLSFEPGALENPTVETLRAGFHYVSGRLLFPEESPPGSLISWEVPAMRDPSAFASFDLRAGRLLASLPLDVPGVTQFNEPNDCPADAPCGCGFRTDFRVTVKIDLRLP